MAATPLDASQTNIAAAPIPNWPLFQAAISPSSVATRERVAAGSDSNSHIANVALPRASLAATTPATAASGKSERKSQNAISAARPSSECEG